MARWFQRSLAKRQNKTWNGKENSSDRIGAIRKRGNYLVSKGMSRRKAFKKAWKEWKS